MSASPPTIRIDFVSDIACPWCIIGLYGLEQALARLDGVVQAELHIHPYELNPHMGPEGQDVSEYAVQKYGMTPAQQAQVRETHRARGADVGFAFNPDGRGRIWNTFDAHRLLHWAGLQGQAPMLALKKALFAAYHCRAENISNAEVLARTCAEVGLDEARAREILATDEYTQAVREDELQWKRAGINSVPAIILNQQYLISGGQPSALFEEALRKIAADSEAVA